MSGSGFVAVLVIDLHFPEAGSLKSKRKELSSIKAQLHSRLGAAVHVLCPGLLDAPSLGAAGADVVVALDGSAVAVAEDVADALVAFVRETEPWAVLAPSTAFGREVAGRAAAATGSGLVGDRGGPTWPYS